MPTSVAAHGGGMKISEANRRPRHERRGAGEGEKRTSHNADQCRYRSRADSTAWALLLPHTVHRPMTNTPALPGGRVLRLHCVWRPGCQHTVAR